MLSRWIYVLIGNDRTGKTTFQRKLVLHLCGLTYERLNRNVCFDITHGYAPKKLKTLFLMSRSYQEKKDEYNSIERYFNEIFQENDVCVLSSHAKRNCIEDIMMVIDEGKKRYYNVGVVFFSNSINDVTKDIALLNWDERFLLDNPYVENSKKQVDQLDKLAWEFAEMVIRRANHQ